MEDKFDNLYCPHCDQYVGYYIESDSFSTGVKAGIWIGFLCFIIPGIIGLIVAYFCATRRVRCCKCEAIIAKVRHKKVIDRYVKQN